MSRSAGKGNSCPVDQRNLLGINSIYLQAQLLCKRLLVGLFLLTAAGAVFNNLLFGTKLAGTFSAFLQAWWHCLQPSLPQRLSFNPLVAAGAAPDREYLEALGTGCRESGLGLRAQHLTCN